MVKTQKDVVIFAPEKIHDEREHGAHLEEEKHLKVI